MTTPSPAHGYVQRFLFEDFDIRGSLVRLEHIWPALQNNRDYPPAILQPLGQLTTCTAMIAANLKQPGRLTLQLQGNGLLNLLVVDCSATLNLRAMAKAGQDATALPANVPLSTLMGQGQLQLTLDLPNTREPYMSLVPLSGERVADVFEHYLSQSEQQDTRLLLACDTQQASGIFIQKLPAADHDQDAWDTVCAFLQTIRDEELLYSEPASLLQRVFPDTDIRLFDPQPLAHDPLPNRDKIIQMLRRLDPLELQQVLEEQGEIVIEDELSNHCYRFNAEQLDDILQSDHDKTT